MDLSTQYLLRSQKENHEYLRENIDIAHSTTHFIINLMKTPSQKIINEFYKHQFKRNDRERFRNWVLANFKPNLAYYLIAENLTYIDSYKVIRGILNYFIDQYTPSVSEEESPYFAFDEVLSDPKYGPCTHTKDSPWHAMTTILHNEELSHVFAQSFVRGPEIETFKTLKLPVQITIHNQTLSYRLTFEAAQGMADVLSYVNKPYHDITVSGVSMMYDIMNSDVFQETRSSIKYDTQYFQVDIINPHGEKSGCVSFLTSDYIHGCMKMSELLNVDHNDIFENLTLMFPDNYMGQSKTCNTRITATPIMRV